MREPRVFPTTRVRSNLRKCFNHVSDFVKSFFAGGAAFFFTEFVFVIARNDGVPKKNDLLVSGALGIIALTVTTAAIHYRRGYQNGQLDAQGEAGQLDAQGESAPLLFVPD